MLSGRKSHRYCPMIAWFRRAERRKMRIVEMRYDVIAWHSVKYKNMENHCRISVRFASRMVIFEWQGIS